MSTQRRSGHNVNHAFVQSRNIRSIGYHAQTGDLHVTFHDTGRYVYHNVPQEVHDGLMMSGSKGNYIHHQIKGKFDFTKL